MLVASVSTDRLSCCEPNLTNLPQRERQMADPSRWLTHHMSYWHSYVGQPTPQPRKIQSSFGRNLQTSTRLYGPESTPIADPAAPSYVDSSTKDLRWQSSPPRFTRLNVPYHIESYVNAHSSRSAFLDHFSSHNNLLNSILHLTFFFFAACLPPRTGQRPGQRRW